MAGIAKKQIEIANQINADAVSHGATGKGNDQIFEWMTSIAFYAEKKNHHPEWFNVYNKVDVILTTHDAGGVSLLDIDLAKKMELQFKK